MTAGQDEKGTAGQDVNEGLSRLHELLQQEPMPLKEIADLINEHIPHHQTMLDYALGHLYACQRREGVSGLDLTDVDLSGKDLRGVDLAYANLRGANLSGANLDGAILKGTRYNLRTVWPSGFDPRISGAVLDLSSDDDALDYLGGVDLRGAILTDVNLRHANLADLDLRHANLTDADLGGAYLEGTNLSGAILEGADLGGAYLSGANLTFADLSDANLRGANLRGAYLVYADLRHASLNGANLKGAKYDDNTKWPEGFDMKRLKE